MKKSSKIVNKLFIAAATVATTLFAGCQQESDEILGNINGLDYRIHDNMTYTEMWDVLWNGYNQNYVGWETETIDWDEANATIRPQIVALDAKYDTLNNQGKLSPDSTEGKAIAAEVKRLFHSAFDSLHDGHTKAYYTDRYTKTREVMFPNLLRLSQHKDYPEFVNVFTPFDKCYFATQDDEPSFLTKFDGNEIARNILIGSILPNMQKKAGSFEPVSEKEINYKARLEKCIEYIKNIDLQSKDNTYAFAIDFEKSVYNNADFADIVKEFELYQLNFNFSEMMMFVTKDNIAYFWLSDFQNWPKQIEVVSANATVYNCIVDTFYNMIDNWHDTVYKLHNERKLNGVILDVRGNGGGDTRNLKNFAGLLFKGNNFKIGTAKRKNGIGRLDYTVSTPFYFPCLGTNSEDITEPIVILTNIGTGSCAEFSAVAVKLHDNGISMGTRTVGAGAVLDDAKNYSRTNYSGIIGEEGKTSVYAFIPQCVTYYDGGIGNIESKGITPDIEVPFGIDESTGCDSQFQSALQYIRSTSK